MIVGKRIPAGLPRILVSACEGPDLIQFAAKVAHASKAAVVSLYVQPRPESGIGKSKSWIRDQVSLARNVTAREAFQTTRRICSEVGVPVLQIYTIHNNLGEMLLDHAATWGVEAVVMRAPDSSRQPHESHETVFKKVYAELPRSIPLIIHDNSEVNSRIPQINK